jgi:uncharacterized protein
MTPAERQLIENLFHRIARLGAINKDREAERLIQEAVREIPDAPYLLVQSVLVQEEALRQADARIRELETRSSSDEGRSFLGRARSSTGSVPVTGPPQTPQAASEPIPRESGQPSFLSSALSTAASVAGGMLLADSIRGLFGGHHEAWGSSMDQAALDRAQDEAQDARDDAEEARQELAADDAALDDMQDAYDDGSGGMEGDNG